ncbi:MAG TPA: DUF4340 domain-containing protein [Candidatus Acidoferrales bacterium]
MKKSTLIILVAAILIGAAAYYFDWKRGEKEAAKIPDDKSKLAFTFQPDEIRSLTISYPADPKSQAVTFEKQNGAWQIIQPLQTGADSASLDGIVQGLAAARTSESEPGTPDRLKVYGLTPPDVGLDFQLKNGAKHSVLLGKKDFTGDSVYAVVDHGTSVALLPEALLVSSDKPLQVLRDRSVLHLDPANVRSFGLKNASGEISATRENGEAAAWNFVKPAASPADADATNFLISAIANAKFVSVESESADNLARYGLASPAITFTAADAKGQSATLLVGKKDADEYFARDTSRPTIFRINQDLYKKLAQSYSDLRSKKISANLDPAAITRAEIHNASGTIVCSRKGEGEWSFEEPTDQKGKSASLEKLFTALDQARSDQIIDHPGADIAAKFTKPAFEVVLTGKDGQKITISISKESGDFVYARNSESPAVYKLKKQILDTLNFKPSDLAF